MPLYYVDCETTGPDRRKDRLATIQFQQLTEVRGIAPLVILKEWELGERGVLKKFEEMTRYFTQRWSCVPVGYNLDFDQSWFFTRGARHGLVEFGADSYDIKKPCIDLHQAIILMNFNAPKPDGTLGNVPACFYNTKLSQWSAKHGSGDGIFKLYEQRRYSAIEEYIRQEARAYIQLFEAMTKEMPGFWHKIIAPKLGLAPLKKV